MIKVALKGLLGRKLRAALTALAIVLGVAMVSGTYVLTDSIKKGFDSIFTAAYSSADAVITGTTAFGSSSEVMTPSFPATLAERLGERYEVTRTDIKSTGRCELPARLERRADDDGFEYQTHKHLVVELRTMR